MSDTKTFTEWERQHNTIFILADTEVLQAQITEDEFLAQMDGDRWNFVTVLWDDRIEFLNKNGYKLTRDNMVDSSLSARQNPPIIDAEQDSSVSVV